MVRLPLPSTSIQPFSNTRWANPRTTDTISATSSTVER